MESLKDSIKEFKKNNGNVTFTVKELLYGLNQKIDRIENRLIQGDKNFSSMKTTLSVHKRLIYGIIGSMGGLLMLILRLSGKI